jgi:hypothetical protein
VERRGGQYMVCPSRRMVSWARAYAKASPAARASCDGGTSDVVDVFDAASYTWSVRHLSAPRAIAVGAGAGAWVGRCRLTVSNPALKAPTVSALETII